MFLSLSMSLDGYVAGPNDEPLHDWLWGGYTPSRHGHGVRLFGSPGTGRIDLERTSVAQLGQLADLRLRVAK